MSVKNGIGAVAIAALMSVSAVAYGKSLQSGDSLYAMCVVSRAVDAPAFCMGYFEGVSDGAEEAPLPYAFCSPPGTTKGQARDVVLRFIARHPESRGWSAAVVIDNALAEAFPRRR